MYESFLLFSFFFLQSHKAVSHRKQNDFKRWHSKWLSSNVSDSSKTSINEWFMGKCDGLVPNKTHKIVKNNLDITPYRTFYKYKAEILKTSSDEPTSLTSTSVNSGGVSGVSLSISAATGNSSNSAKPEMETGSKVWEETETGSSLKQTIKEHNPTYKFQPPET